ncbi:MAG: hypothetical protein KKG75_03555 [Nanoarchaeota archaeon]|nr:hypothetical protein [Nanoarchaeota archaeon]
MKIQEEYENIKKKYTLPRFEEMNEEFEISSIEVEKVNSLTRAILRVMCNKMVILLNYIEPVINPSPQNLHGFIEVENTNNDEKKEVFTFYKNLSYKYHKSSGLELSENEENVAKEIKEVWKDWKEIKLKFKNISKIINNAWLREKEKDKAENVG